MMGYQCQCYTNVNASNTQMPGTSGLITKAQNDSDKQDLKKKLSILIKRIPNTRGLVKKTSR